MTLADIRDAILIIKSHNPIAEVRIDFTDDGGEVELVMTVDDSFIRTPMWKELQSFCMRIVPGTPHNILHIGGRLYSELTCQHGTLVEGVCTNCGAYVTGGQS